MSTFDVAIVGGGVIGVSAAFELAAQKLRVVVLDRQEPGREASWAAAGMLSPGPHTARDFPLVPLAKESLRIYPEFVAGIEDASGKSTAYARSGALELFDAVDGEADRDKFLAEYRRLGLSAELLSVGSAHKIEKSLGASARAAVWVPEEGIIEPRRLMDALLAGARNRGVKIRPNWCVTSILCEGARCAGVASVDEKIVAGHVIIAAGCFSAGISGPIGGDTGAGATLAGLVPPTRPVRGQMLAVRREGVEIECVLRSRKVYVVPRRDGSAVIGSTLEEAGFEKRVTPAGMREILDAALELIPAFASAEILETWAGLRPGTPDDLPILGPAHIEGLTFATGHYRNGILLAPITAKLVQDWVTAGKVHFEVEAFSPFRFKSEQSGASKSTADLSNLVS